MIDKRTEELAALYVLDALDVSERSEFEAMLALSPELGRLVRELSSGLHGPVSKLQAGPQRVDLLEGIHQALGVESAFPQPRARGLPWAWIWGAAACLLLAFNLILLILLGDQGSPSRDLDGEPASVAGQVVTGQSSPASPGGDSLAGQEVLNARIERLETDLRDREALLEEFRRSKEQLEEENEVVKSFNQEWQREFNRLAARFTPFFELNDRMSRFTVIEMVDSGSINKPGASRGFADLAGRFLTGEGNIAGAGPSAAVGPSPAITDEDGAGKSAPTLAAVARGNTTSNAQPGELADEEILAPPSTGEQEAVGFTVWRDDEQTGFLDLYNLPQTDSGEPFLWVRSSEMEPYVPVGFIPELENGTGSMFYSVEEPNFTPTEILITSENSVQTANQPTGSVLLRGP